MNPDVDKLDRMALSKVQLRQGDIYNLNIDDHSAAAVVMHQVLHYLTDPGRAIREAARILAPDGRLLLVDFAPHELEFLREELAHVRLGFGPAEIEQWLKEAGLELQRFQALVPPHDGGRDKLTVSLWLAAPARNQHSRQRSGDRRAGAVQAEEDAA